MLALFQRSDSLYCCFITCFVTTTAWLISGYLLGLRQL